MLCHVKDKKNQAAPFIWHQVQWCLNMETGQAFHFPAGTYHDQVASDWGRVELELMQTAWRMWYIKEVLTMEKYSQADMEFISWVDKDDPPAGGWKLTRYVNYQLSN